MNMFHVSQALEEFLNADVKSLDVSDLKKSVGTRCFSFKPKAEDNEELVHMFVPNGVWLTGAPMLWNQGYTGKGCTVGIIDTGIDASHPDLKNNIQKHESFIGDENAVDLNFHGTHVAGTVGANGILKGVAPEATINDYRVFDSRGITRVGAIEAAIVKAVDDGCDVINLSLGSATTTTMLKNVVEYAREKEVLLVVAAGNESVDKEWTEIVVSYPANYNTVLSVASIDYQLSTGKIDFSKTKFSNRNPEVDVCADGFNVISSIPNMGYAYLSGTSMACPHVTGFAALMHQKAHKVTKGTDHSICNLYSLVKANTIPIDVSILGVEDEILDNVTGAGLVSGLTEIPTRSSESEFYLPNLNIELSEKLALKLN